MYIVRDRLAGNYIDFAESYEEGVEIIHAFEEEDKRDGIYEENFYEVVEVE